MLDLSRFFRSTRLWVASLVLVTSSLAYQLQPPPDPLAECGFTPPPLAHPNDSQAITITVWANGYQQECTRPYLPALAAPSVTKYRVNVEPRLFPISDDAYLQILSQRAAVHQLANIIQVDDSALPNLVQRGFLVPLDNCIAAHAAFHRIRPQLWDSVQYKGSIWGIPYRVNFSILFFNKIKLRELGWTDERIESLPEQIRAGQFTLQDMAVLARQGVRDRIIEPGFGIWSKEHDTPALNVLPFLLSFDAVRDDPATGQMILQRTAFEEALSFYRNLQLTQVRSRLFTGSDIVGYWNKRVNLRDAYTEGRVLFWIENIGERGELALDKVQDLGGFRYFEDHIGIALIPHAVPGASGHIQSLFTGSFAVTSEQVSGQRNQAAACELLAKTMSPEILAPLLEREAATPLNTIEYATSLVTDTLAYLQDYRYPEAYFPSWDLFALQLDQVIIEFETSDISAQEATTRLIERLRTAYGNSFIVK